MQKEAFKLDIYEYTNLDNLSRAEFRIPLTFLF